MSEFTFGITPVENGYILETYNAWADKYHQEKSFVFTAKYQMLDFINKLVPNAGYDKELEERNAAKP